MSVRRNHRYSQERIVSKLQKEFTILLFKHVTMTLFEKDVLLFAFLMAY